MSHFSLSRGARFFSVAFLSSVFFIASALPAWANDEDVTKDVAAMKTEHKWFYWPGWAFVALIVLVIGLVIFGWVKSVLFPKYRGRKVVQ